jgi:superoxide dismutase, Fe-Mn family
MLACACYYVTISHTTMHTYEIKKFDLPELKGLSQKQLEVHLGLYSGYVKHINLLREQIHDLEHMDKEKYAYAVSELRRRLSFEFNGMRMHEYYFAQFEQGKTPASEKSHLREVVSNKYNSWSAFLEHVNTVSKTRGIGWSILYYDPVGKTPHVAWVTDHELGQLGGLPVILALDMWEHAYMVDYTPAEKAKYLEACFANLNWKVVEDRFDAAT